MLAHALATTASARITTATVDLDARMNGEGTAI
jgi:hypothetical protein